MCIRDSGYAMLHGGAHDAAIDSCHPDAFLDSPTFVYRPDNGAMFLTNVGKVPGTNGDVRSLVLGNVEPNPGSPRKRMGFMNCADTVVAPAWHPFVTIDAPFPAVAETVTPQPDAWLYTPRSWTPGGIPFQRVESETGSRAAWLLRTGTALKVPVPAGAAVTEIFAQAVRDGATLAVGPPTGATRHQLDAGMWMRIGPSRPQLNKTLHLTAEGALLVAAVRFLRDG